jgi:hypothetical protein
MTNVGLRIAPRADGSHVRVAVFIVNNKRKQRSGSDHTRRLVLHTTQQRVAALSCPGRSAARAKRSGALQTRDRYGPWRSRISDASLASARAASHPGHVTAPLASLSHNVKQPYSTQRRGAAPQFIASACSAVGSQDDAASSMNCGSISGCAGAMSVRIIVPSLRMKNSSGFQTPPFQAMVTRSR